MNGNDYNKLITRSPRELGEIPENFRTKKLCTKAISLNPWCVLYTPLSVLSPDMVKIATDSEPLTIALFPQEWLSQELCSNVFTRNHEMIDYIPEKYITNEMREICKMRRYDTSCFRAVN